MVIHATAVVDPGARIGRDVEIGPFAEIGAEVTLGDGTVIHGHAVVRGPTQVGRECTVHPFAVLGGAPQVKNSERGHGTSLVIGDHNVFREHVTVHRGSESERTRIGDENLFMVGAHIAHDAFIGSHVTVANGVQLAGHVVVEDHATFGGLSGAAQFVRVGESAFVAAGAMCERDVPPFVIVQGDRARVRALNVVGLRRRGVPESSIGALRAAYRRLFLRGHPVGGALGDVAEGDPYVQRLVAMLERSRGR